jgi:hypothetical protein
MEMFGEDFDFVSIIPQPATILSSSPKRGASTGQMDGAAIDLTDAQVAVWDVLRARLITTRRFSRRSYMKRTLRAWALLRSPSIDRSAPEPASLPNRSGNPAQPRRPASLIVSFAFDLEGRSAS